MPPAKRRTARKTAAKKTTARKPAKRRTATKRDAEDDGTRSRPSVGPPRRQRRRRPPRGSRPKRRTAAKKAAAKRHGEAPTPGRRAAKKTTARKRIGRRSARDATKKAAAKKTTARKPAKRRAAAEEGRSGVSDQARPGSAAAKKAATSGIRRSADRQEGCGEEAPREAPGREAPLAQHKRTLRSGPPGSVAAYVPQHRRTRGLRAPRSRGIGAERVRARSRSLKRSPARRRRRSSSSRMRASNASRCVARVARRSRPDRCPSWSAIGCGGEEGLDLGGDVVVVDRLEVVDHLGFEQEEPVGPVRRAGAGEEVRVAGGDDAVDHELAGDGGGRDGGGTASTGRDPSTTSGRTPRITAHTRSRRRRVGLELAVDEVEEVHPATPSVRGSGALLVAPGGDQRREVAAGSQVPFEPSVSTSSSTSAPAAAQLASVAPHPNSMSSGCAPIASTRAGTLEVARHVIDGTSARRASTRSSGTSTSNARSGSRTTRRPSAEPPCLGGVAAERAGTVGEAERRGRRARDSTGVPSSRWHGTSATTGSRTVARPRRRTSAARGRSACAMTSRGRPRSAAHVAPDVGGAVERAGIVEHRRSRVRCRPVAHVVVGGDHHDRHGRLPRATTCVPTGCASSRARRRVEVLGEAGLAEGERADRDHDTDATRDVRWSSARRHGCHVCYRCRASPSEASVGGGHRRRVVGHHRRRDRERATRRP